MKFVKIASIAAVGMLLILGCAVRPVISQDAFNAINIGSDISKVQVLAGEPYKIKKIDNNHMEYTYIERIVRGRGDSDQRHYIFVVSNGKIVNKQCQEIFKAVNMHSY